jgi:hypothetical protein
MPDKECVLDPLRFDIEQLYDQMSSSFEIKQGSTRPSSQTNNPLDGGYKDVWAGALWWSTMGGMLALSYACVPDFLRAVTEEIGAQGNLTKSEAMSPCHVAFFVVVTLVLAFTASLFYISALQR